LHPGEKKLLDITLARCNKLPVGISRDITAVIRSSSSTDQDFLYKLSKLLDHLDQWLDQEGFNPSTLYPELPHKIK